MRHDLQVPAQQSVTVSPLGARNEEGLPTSSSYGQFFPAGQRTAVNSEEAAQSTTQLPALAPTSLQAAAATGLSGAGLRHRDPARAGVEGRTGAINVPLIERFTFH